MFLQDNTKSKCALISGCGLVLASCIFISGCGNQFEANKKSEPDPVIPQPSVLPEKNVHYYSVDDFTYSLKADAAPHNYELSVFWPQTTKTLSVSINKKIVRTIKPDEGNSFIQLLSDKSKIQLSILSESYQPLKEWNFETPVDYVFNSTEILSQDTEVKAHRVFFKNKALIETREFALSITADEIYFEEGSKVLNFREPPISPPQKDGANGGDIKIQSKIAMGKIELELSGGEGGKGMEAFPWVIPHPSGKDGVAGVCRRDSLVPSCITQPIDAENGPNGNKGKTGFQGQKGGNSGRVIFEIADQSEVEVVHSETPGKGGEGGEGGIGQLKGKPGKSVPRDESCMCPQGKDGEDIGKNGDPGDKGPEGPKGSVGSVCISIGRGVGVCK